MRSMRLLLLLRQGSIPAMATLVFLVITYSAGIGRVHLFDWDEVNFAECTREMRLSGEYLYAQIGYLPFWEKPPLFFWVQAASMALWGETEWAARFPNVLIMGLTLWVLYSLGREWHSTTSGWLWMFFYGVALLPAFYARSGLIDPLFNLFMLLAAMSGGRAFSGRVEAWKAGLQTGLWMALAVLTKGPVGIGLPALALITLALSHRQFRVLFRVGLMAALIVSLIGGSWLGLLYLSGKAYLITDFWAYQWRLFSTPDAGHGGPWYYHIVLWLVGLLPASPWAVRALRHIRLFALPHPAQALLWLTLWTLLIFSIVKTKIIHYSSLGYFGVTYLAAIGWHKSRKSALPWLLSGVGLLVFIAVSGVLPLFMKQVESWLHWIEDPFAREVLRGRPVVWSGWEGWPGLVALAGLGILFLMPLGAVMRLVSLGLVTVVCESFVLWVYVPRVEAYSQAPLVRFCQRAAAEGAVAWPLGFKSYIPYFYGRMKPSLSPGKWGSVKAFEAALLGGEAGPVYFVSRVDRYKSFVESLNLQVIEQSGGYVLLLPGSSSREAGKGNSPIATGQRAYEKIIKAERDK